MKKGKTATEARISNILRRAESLVYGPRAEDYGHPKDNFRCIADMLDAYLRRRGMLNDDHPGVEPRDVAMLCVLIKIGRDANKASPDNLIDIAGYVATAERLDEPR